MMVWNNVCAVTKCSLKKNEKDLHEKICFVSYHETVIIIAFVKVRFAPDRLDKNVFNYHVQYSWKPPNLKVLIVVFGKEPKERLWIMTCARRKLMSPKPAGLCFRYINVGVEWTLVLTVRANFVKLLKVRFPWDWLDKNVFNYPVQYSWKLRNLIVVFEKKPKEWLRIMTYTKRKLMSRERASLCFRYLNVEREWTVVSTHRGVIYSDRLLCSLPLHQ